MIDRLKQFLIGKPRDIRDPDVFHKISLAAFLAWVGLGADGLSSSACGPDESYRALGAHTHLALLLVIMTAVTISVSVASACDAVYSFLPPHWAGTKLLAAGLALLLLLLLNLRGVRESVTFLVPIFLVFVISHVGMILYAVGSHLPVLPEVFKGASVDLRSSIGALGFAPVAFILLRAYSMGGRHLHGYRGGFQRRGDAARAESSDRQAHDAPDVHLARVHGRRHPAGLSSRARLSSRGKDDECCSSREPLRRMGSGRPRFDRADVVLGSRAAACRRSGGLS